MTPGPLFATDDEVIVTRGSRKGSSGTVKRPTPFLARHYDVRFDDGLTRAIHETFLRDARLPAPSDSDDDICGTAWRKVTCP